MKDNKRSERGMVIVEATIVFPTIFLVIIFMIFAGNAYFQKCRVDSYVNQYAIAGASYCADPMLENAEKDEIPNFRYIKVKPYRYVIGDMRDIEVAIWQKLKTKIDNMNTGLFSGMKPTNVIVDTKFNNGFVYSTFSVDVDYKVTIPVRLLGASDFIIMNISSHADMPVSDTVEMIRNINLVEDYMQRTGVDKKFEEMIKTVKSWFGKVKGD